VRDLSESGAGLQLDNLLLSPTDFNHLVDGFRNTLACRLIWKDGCFARIAFEPVSNGANSSDEEPAS